MEQMLRGFHAEQRGDRTAARRLPAMVTRPGSPPNAAMLRWTHSSASSQSRTPGSTAPFDPSETIETEAVGDGHRDHAVSVEVAAVVPGLAGDPAL